MKENIKPPPTPSRLPSLPESSVVGLKVGLVELSPVIVEVGGGEDVVVVSVVVVVGVVLVAGVDGIVFVSIVVSVVVVVVVVLGVFDGVVL